MLASIFIVQGFDTLLHPERVVPAAEPVVRPIADRVPDVPDQVEQAVRLNGAVQLVAGAMLALGRWPRLSALTIAATLVPTTYAGQRFWEIDFLPTAKAGGFPGSRPRVPVSQPTAGGVSRAV
jgi:uncharacterized membrane protein YphA (DoxX/SURF4 family)